MESSIFQWRGHYENTKNCSEGNMIGCIIFDVMGVIFTVGDDVEGLLIP